MREADQLRIPSVQEAVFSTSEDIVRELRALQKQVLALKKIADAKQESEPPVVNIPAPIVNVPAPIVNVKAPAVHVPDSGIGDVLERIEAALSAFAGKHSGPLELHPNDRAVLEKIHAVIESSGKASSTSKGSLIRGGGSNILGFVSSSQPSYSDQTNQKLSLTTSGELRVSSSEAQYAIRIDEASSTITYVGDASPGTDTSAASWRIKRLDTTSGTIVLWADGNASFDNVWDNRAALSYS